MPVQPATIDLNADVGEAVTEAGDEALLRVVTSASLACGAHAGDAHVMRVTCAAAVREGVRLGAHVSYDDREGFGRRELGTSPERVAEDVVFQLGALQACARREGGQVRYVKPHGALYGRANRDPEMARALAAAVAQVAPGLAVMTPPASAMARAAAEHDLPVIAEGFADRRYAADGSLVSRSRHGALLGAQDAARQAVALATRGAVAAGDGRTLRLAVASVCVHSDTPGALEVARTVRDALAAAGIAVGAPA